MGITPTRQGVAQGRTRISSVLLLEQILASKRIGESFVVDLVVLEKLLQLQLQGVLFTDQWKIYVGGAPS